MTLRLSEGVGPHLARSKNMATFSVLVLRKPVCDVVVIALMRYEDMALEFDSGWSVQRPKCNGHPVSEDRFPEEPRAAR